MQPEVLKFLNDVLECAISIEGFVRDKTLDDLINDNLLRSGVYYKFIILGEALTQLRRQDPGTFDRISESSRIVGFRNQIIHGYQVIRNAVTWQIIQDKLPLLRRELEGLLAE